MDFDNDKYLKYKKKYFKLYYENKDLIENYYKYQSGGQAKKNKLIAFTAKWCGHCQVFKPTWSELQKSKLNIELINYDSEKHKNKIDEYKISGFPTIMLKKVDGSLKEYNGNRSKNDLIKFINEN